MSRCSKLIGQGFRRAGIVDASSRGEHDPAQGVRPAASEARGLPASRLPGWLRIRSANLENGAVARSSAEGSDSSEQYLTVAEAASLLRVSERTVRRHLARGRIRHVRVGRQIRILRASLVEGW